MSLFSFYTHVNKISLSLSLSEKAFFFFLQKSLMSMNVPIIQKCPYLFLQLSWNLDSQTQKYIILHTHTDTQPTKADSLSNNLSSLSGDRDTVTVSLCVRSVMDSWWQIQTSCGCLKHTPTQCTHKHTHTHTHRVSQWGESFINGRHYGN